MAAAAPVCHPLPPPAPSPLRPSLTLRQFVDEVARAVELPQGQLVVVLVIQHVEQVRVEGVDVLHLGWGGECARCARCVGGGGRAGGEVVCCAVGSVLLYEDNMLVTCWCGEVTAPAVRPCACIRVCAYSPSAWAVQLLVVVLLL